MSQRRPRNSPPRTSRVSPLLVDERVDERHQQRERQRQPQRARAPPGPPRPPCPADHDRRQRAGQHQRVPVQRADQRERAAEGGAPRPRARRAARSAGCGRRERGSLRLQRELLHGRPVTATANASRRRVRSQRARPPAPSPSLVERRSRARRSSSSRGRSAATSAGAVARLDRAGRPRRARRAARAPAVLGSKRANTPLRLGPLLERGRAAHDRAPAATAPPPGGSRSRCPARPSDEPEAGTPARSSALLRGPAGARTRRPSHSTRTGPALALDAVEERLREGADDRRHGIGGRPVAVVPLHPVAGRELVLGGAHVGLDAVHEEEPVAPAARTRRPRARRSTARSAPPKRVSTSNPSAAAASRSGPRAAPRCGAPSSARGRSRASRAAAAPPACSSPAPSPQPAEQRTAATQAASSEPAASRHLDPLGEGAHQARLARHRAVGARRGSDRRAVAGRVGERRRAAGASPSRPPRPRPRPSSS